MRRDLSCIKFREFCLTNRATLCFILKYGNHFNFYQNPYIPNEYAGFKCESVLHAPDKTSGE